MPVLSILHFNDIYRISPQKVSPHSPETIDTAKFAAVLDDIRSTWADLSDGKKDGLPWILSNIVDITTSQVPDRLREFLIFEKAGIRIGVIGLVEKYKPPPTAFVMLDISLAKSLLAFSPAAQTSNPIFSSHGVDVILGGHDHLYFVSKGVNSWEGYDLESVVLGAEDDQGDVLVFKSGTDFRDLSELRIELENAPPESVRRAVIKHITGKRHTIQPGSKSSPSMQTLLTTLLSAVSDTMTAPVCKTAVIIDCRSQYIRTAESAAGNLIADIIRHAYDDALCMQGCGGSDGVLICAGTLRGDSTYGPGSSLLFFGGVLVYGIMEVGVLTLGNLLEILPFEDPTVVLELDGAAIWDALESSLSTWPAQEGRFPVISGFRVSWDSRRSPGSRVLGVWTILQKDKSVVSSAEISGASTPKLIDGDQIRRDSGRKYKIVTREYMAQGHDGFLALKGKPYLVDDESGQLLSSIVRKYLLGSQFVNMMVEAVSKSSLVHSLQPRTESTISQQAFSRKDQEHEIASEHWRKAKKLAIRWSRSHYKDQLAVCSMEHMSQVDAFDGGNIRKGLKQTKKASAYDENHLLTLHPEIDGRLKNIAHPLEI
ncbi:hypothetical protein H0H93_011546 [Arthromyces matolae]|nr:hypothetical protein H0H93_011546 [Arthromyces matolae]